MKQIITKIFLLSALFLFSSPELLAQSKDAKEEENEDEKPSLLSTTLKDGEIFSCSSDIYYYWQPIISQPKDEDDDKDQDKDTEQDKYKELFITLVERGKNGFNTKAKLESRLATARTDAMNTCRNNHSSAKCISSKLSTKNSQLAILDFESKKVLKQSIIDSCEEISGKCIKAENTEIICEIYTSPDAKPKEDPEKSK